jgi:hypothetical protein
MTAISVVFIAKNKANRKQNKTSEKTKFKVELTFAQIDSNSYPTNITITITMNVKQISVDSQYKCDQSLTI